MIAFTGSKEVGLRIAERSAKIQPGQIWIKRPITEMDGKNSIVVDETADLDLAARESRRGKKENSRPYRYASLILSMMLVVDKPAT